MGIVPEVIAALLFVGSTGVFFNERFRANRVLVLCAGVIALLSTYFLTEQIVRQTVGRMLAPQEHPVPSPVTRNDQNSTGAEQVAPASRQDSSQSIGEQSPPQQTRSEPAHDYRQAGWLGAVVVPTTGEVATAAGLIPGRGASISSIVPSSPAALAGLRAGDIILVIDGQPVWDDLFLTRQVLATRPQQRVVLVVQRGTSRFEREVELSNRPGREASDVQQSSAQANNPSPDRQP